MSDQIAPRDQELSSGGDYQLLLMDFGMTADRFGSEYLMRRMMRDPWLGFSDALIRALVLEGEHRIVPAIGDLAEDADAEMRRRKALADQYAAFTEEWVSGLERPFRRVLWHSMEALPYGHKLCEIEVAIVGQALVPIDIAPKPRSAYTMKLDKRNRLVGVLPHGNPGVAEVPAWSVFVFSLQGPDDNPHGSPALERAYEAWYRKGCAKGPETKALTAFAGGLIWGELDKDAKSTIDVKVNGVEDTVFLAQQVAVEAAKLKTGRVPVFPPGVALKTIQPATTFAAFDSTYDRCDREMATAFFVAARSVMEARFGSKADSATAEGMVASVRDWLRGELCEAVRGLFRRFVVANFGDEAAELCPSYDIVTEERGELTAVSAAIEAMDRIGVLTPELADHYLSLVGVPDAVRRSVMDALEGASEEQEDEDDSTTRFAKKAPKVPARALAEVDRKTGKLVSRYDKSLRKLTSRWLGGRVGDDAFAERFSELLTTGHGEAARLGARLAGHRGPLPEELTEYVAATLSDENGHLADLIEDVASGAKSPAQANLAARRYGARMSGTISAAFHEASPDDAELWWQLGAAEHCDDCPRFAEMSPFLKDELPTRPREGETACNLGCQCRLVRGDGKAGPGPVDLGDYED
jgi:hypothetical protein